MFNPRQALVLTFLWFLGSITVYRYQSQKPVIPKQPISVELLGEVTTAPYVEGQSQFFDLGVIKIMGGGEGLRLARVQVRARTDPKFSYGDELRVSGELTPRGAISFPEIEKVGVGGNKFQKALFSLRTRLEGIVFQSLPQPESGLLAGILLGSKTGLLYDWDEIYRRVSLSHVVVASGYNVTVLVTFLSIVARPLGLGASFAFSLVGIALFTLMLGAEPPILRAAIMGAVTVWGTYLGRSKDTLRVLTFSVFLMILADPSIVDSLSFKLSLFASLGIILLAAPLREKFPISFLRFLTLDEEFYTTFAATLFVFPIISYYFGQVTPASFLVNTLVLWVIPPVMLLGSVTVFLGLFSTGISRVVGWFPWLLLRFFNQAALYFSRFPLVLDFKANFAFVFFSYFLLGSLCLVLRKRKESK